MTALSPLFLWLIPLALLPVVIHLLNRLRYQTVHWAAMMFLRSADRDASRRARIRQWIILTTRCLMLLMFLLALVRLQSKGRLARFLDPGSNLVIVLFDRSASMEQQRGGVSGRERALTLVQQGLDELGGNTRVYWMDSVDGGLLPLPRGIEVDVLPVVTASSTSSDVGLMVRRALTEVLRLDVGRAELWVTTDRQTSAWLPEGTAKPDWSEWTGLQDQVTLRVLDVGSAEPDPGNRTLQLVSGPVRRGNTLRVELALRREREDPESVPLRIETGGLSLQEEILVEGSFFQWEQEIPLGREGAVTHARLSLPADTQPLDHDVFVSWKDPGELLAGASLSADRSKRVFRAASLPREGVRRWEGLSAPSPETSLWITDDLWQDNPGLQEWVASGGILVQAPKGEDLPPPASDSPLSIPSWVEGSGVLATQGRDPLRLDLVEIFSASDLPEEPGTQVLARLSDGRPFLTRISVGRGQVYQLATLPDPVFSNLDDGYVLVPLMQRLFLEAAASDAETGTRIAGEVFLEEPDSWASLEEEGRSVESDAGRFERGANVLALNRPAAEDDPDQLPLEELKAWAHPLDLRVFEDTSTQGEAEGQRSEFTGFLALLGLVFLVVESWLLTLNIRRTSVSTSAWEGASA